VQFDSVGVRVGRVTTFVVAAATMATSAREVSAQELLAQSAERQAREHYRRGKDAYAAQRFEEAYREFEAGYRLSDRPLFLLNMGHAKRRAGDLPMAKALFRRFLQLQPDSPHRAEVENLLRDVEAALPAPAQPLEPLPAAPPVVPRTPPPPPAPSPAPPVLRVPRPEPPPAPPPSVMAAPNRPPEESPPPRRWWLWAGAGGAVVAGVLVAVLASGRAGYTKQGSLGTLGSP
jgi:tetratricopeptide (TPR) repeat protein